MADSSMLLPHDVEPGQQVRVRLSIGIPEHIHPGSYVLRVDAVNELMVWFSDLPGNEPHEFAVTIR